MMKAAELAYVRVQVPDLDLAEKFYSDFGLVVRTREPDRIYLRGTGPDHHLLVAQRGDRRLLALAFEVGSLEELTAASGLEGASGVEAIEEPGGGHRVTLADPDGNRVELVHGIVKTTPLPVDLQHFNSASGRERRRNAVVRPQQGPSRVLRLGHAVLRTPNVARLSNWYQTMLGLLVSDEVPLPDGSDMLMSFVRLDQGEHAVDHHVFQALKGAPNQLHHISFEVQDIDDLQMGHRALQAGGYKHMWGIGRHLQGSQIFDYWLDPFGVMYEHWTDTDVLDASVPKSIRQIHEIDSPWGPPMPEDFLHQGTN